MEIIYNNVDYHLGEEKVLEEGTVFTSLYAELKEGVYAVTVEMDQTNRIFLASVYDQTAKVLKSIWRYPAKEKMLFRVKKEQAGICRIKVQAPDTIGRLMKVSIASHI